MDTDKLLAALAANADRARAPIVVDVPNVGKFYIRAVTIEEWEKLEAADGSATAAGLARALCSEDGERLPKETAALFADALARQPTEVMHAMLAAVRGAAPGN